MIKKFMFVLLSVALASGDLCGMISPEQKILSCIREENPTLRKISLYGIKLMIEEHTVSDEWVISLAAFNMRQNDELSQHIACELFEALMKKNKGSKEAEAAAIGLILHDEILYGYPVSMDIKAYAFKTLVKLVESGYYTDKMLIIAESGMIHKDENMRNGALLFYAKLHEQLNKESKLISKL